MSCGARCVASFSSKPHFERSYSRLAILAFVFARNFTAEAPALPFAVGALLSGSLAAQCFSKSPQPTPPWQASYHLPNQQRLQAVSSPLPLSSQPRSSWTYAHNERRPIVLSQRPPPSSPLLPPLQALRTTRLNIAAPQQTPPSRRAASDLAGTCALAIARASKRSAAAAEMTCCRSVADVAADSCEAGRDGPVNYAELRFCCRLYGLNGILP